jgi:hypothetical protein
MEETIRGNAAQSNVDNDYLLATVRNIPYKTSSSVQRPAYLTNAFHIGQKRVDVAKARVE